VCGYFVSYLLNHPVRQIGCVNRVTPGDKKHGIDARARIQFQYTTLRFEIFLNVPIDLMTKIAQNDVQTVGLIIACSLFAESAVDGVSMTNRTRVTCQNVFSG
jgi:hypothetical protein